MEVEKLAGPEFPASREADRAVHLYVPITFCINARVCRTFKRGGGGNDFVFISRKENLLTVVVGEVRGGGAMLDPRDEGQDGRGRRRRRRGTAWR